MTASRRFEFTTRELPGELQFQLDSDSGGKTSLVILAVLIPVIIAILAPFYGASPITFALCLAILLAGFVWIGINIAQKWNKTMTTTLSVTSQRFEATGDSLKSDWMGNFTRPGKVTVPVSEIKSFGYGMGSEDTPSGFWVQCGLFKNFCLLPGLKRELCTAVSIAIARNFPQIGANIQGKG